MNTGLHRSIHGVFATLLLATSACSALRPSHDVAVAQYSLDLASGPQRALPTGGAPATTSTAILVVNPLQAAAGFDSRRIAFVREAHRLEYFAHSEWIDTPARMLTPLIAAAIERSGAFEAVVLTPSAAQGDISVNTQLLRLQQDFSATPSMVRLTLHVDIVDSATRRVLAAREFDERVRAASENPEGGVLAANLAVQRVMEQISRFCAEASAAWRAPAPR